MRFWLRFSAQARFERAPPKKTKPPDDPKVTGLFVQPGGYFF
jgi:hypothetical protein